MQQRRLQQVSRPNIYVTTLNIFLISFCIWTLYVSLSDYLVLILKFYTVLVCLHDVRHFFNHKWHSSKHVSNIFTEKIWYPFSIMSQLRYQGPFLRDMTHIYKTESSMSTCHLWLLRYYVQFDFQMCARLQYWRTEIPDKAIPVCSLFLAAKDGMARLQSKFQNLNPVDT